MLSLKDQEALGRIDQAIESLSGNGILSLYLGTRIHARIVTRIIDISDEDMSITLFDKTLNLSSKPRVFAVLKTIYEQPDMKVSKSILLKRMYGISIEVKRSRRLKESHEHNVVKLLSRARRVVQENLQFNEHQNLQWLPYDPIERKWGLVKFLS